MAATADAEITTDGHRVRQADPPSDPDQQSNRSTSSKSNTTSLDLTGDEESSFIRAQQEESNVRRETERRSQRLGRNVLNPVGHPRWNREKAMSMMRWVIKVNIFLAIILLALILLGVILTACTVRYLVYFVNNTNFQQLYQQYALTADSTQQPYIRGGGENTVDWIHVAIDWAATPACQINQDRAQPCKIHSAYITADNDVVRPIRCVDQVHMENKTINPDSCLGRSNTYELFGEKGQVRVIRPGQYLILVHITSRLPEMAQVHFGVAVNGQHLAFLCTVQSYGISRTGQAAPYSQCSMQGMRQLRVGDKVSLFASQGGIPLQSLSRSTYMQIARISD